MTMLAEVFQPVVHKAGFPVLCNVNTVPGHPSAANIAESVVATAREVDADMLVVASHGGCVAPPLLNGAVTALIELH